MARFSLGCLDQLLLPAARSELGGHGSAEAVQRSASAGAPCQLALLTDGGRYVSTARSSYLDADSGSLGYDFTNRNTTFMTWNLMHLAWMLKQVGGMLAHGDARCR